jgi:hypothetical protein
LRKDHACADFEQSEAKAAVEWTELEFCFTTVPLANAMSRGEKP